MNYHIFKVKYYGATNTSGSRIGIVSERFDQRVTISDYECNSSVDGAEKYLRGRGYDIVGIAEGKDCMYIISSTFEPLK